VVDATAPQWDAPDTRIAAKTGKVSVLNKVDLVKSPQIADGLAVSAKTGEGVAALVELLADRVRDSLAVGEPAIVTRARHRAELEAACLALERFRGERGGPELKAEELRLAARHLGRLTGRIDVEEVLGAIFAEFCIGK
jgi:tRNA modification GTPase